jgi:hypothetical protein
MIHGGRSYRARAKKLRVLVDSGEQVTLCAFDTAYSRITPRNTERGRITHSALNYSVSKKPQGYFFISGRSRGNQIPIRSILTIQGCNVDCDAVYLSNFRGVPVE